MIIFTKVKANRGVYPDGSRPLEHAILSFRGRNGFVLWRDKIVCAVFYTLKFDMECDELVVKEAKSR